MTDTTDEISTKKKMSWKLKIYLILIVIFIGIIVIVCVKSHIAKNNFIQSAQEDKERISSYFNSADYSSLMSALEDYEDTFSYKNGYKRYCKSLPDDLSAEKVCDEYKVALATKLYNQYQDLKAKYADISLTNTSEDEFNGVQSILNTTDDLISYFPDGFTYKDSSDNRIKVDDIQPIKDDYNTFYLTQSVAFFYKGDKSTALTNLEYIIDDSDISDYIKKEAKRYFNKFLPSCTATDFHILSGSEEISVFKSGKNFGWQCPYCGYFNMAVGTSSILMELNKHYIGETSTYKGAIYCYRCQNISSYTLSIKWE